MCGRYTLAAPDPAQLRARFGLGESVAIRPRYNIAPGDRIVAVTTDKAGAPRTEELRWGLVPPFLKEPGPSGRMINARAESVADKPAYRGAFERFRCLIPADGFYEWGSGAALATDVVARGGAPDHFPGDDRKRAFHITRADQAPFAFAGLWSVWHRGTPEEIRSATIITTAANPVIAPLHERMPAILASADEALWIDPGTPAPMLHRLLGGLTAEDTALRPVGPAVNDARYDGPECLADPPAAEQPTQTALF